MVVFLKNKKVRERKCKRNSNMHCSLLDSTATVFLVIVQFQNILNNQFTLHNDNLFFLVPLFACRLCRRYQATSVYFNQT